MARRPEPRWYASRNGWYAWIEGKQIRLGTDKDQAWAAFHRRMLDRGKMTDHAISCAVLFDLLLEWTKTHRDPLTYRGYLRFLTNAAKQFGKIDAANLTPHVVERWLASNDWGATTQHNAITAVKRAYSWGVKRGHIAANPIQHMERPTPATRQHIPTKEQFQRMLDAADDVFRDLLMVLYLTGMRPSEAYRLEAKQIDFDRRMAVFAKHKTGRKTKKPRVVYLTPEAVGLLKGLAKRWPAGPVLRNTAGQPWNDCKANDRFEVMRDKLGMGKEASAGAIRHLFVTDALEAGVPIATVAELVGHKSTAMIERHYGHLSQRSKHLIDAVDRIRSNKES